MSLSTSNWPHILRPIPAEYTNQLIRCELIHYQMSTSLGASKLVDYYGFTGIGPPPQGLGEPGDLYVDEHQDTMELYAQDTNFEWRAWSGPDALHTHPNSEDWCLWASASGFAWFSPKFVRDDGAPGARGGMDRRAMITQALSYKMGAIAGHHALPDAHSGSIGTKRAAPPDSSEHAERHKRQRQGGKQSSASHIVTHVLSDTSNNCPDALNCESCFETQQKAAELDDLLKKAMDRAINERAISQALQAENATLKDAGLASPSLMTPSIEGPFTGTCSFMFSHSHCSTHTPFSLALFDTCTKSFGDAMRSTATAATEAYDAGK